MKKHALKQTASISGGTNTATGASRAEKTKPTMGGKTGLVSETSLNGPNGQGMGTGASRYVSTKPGVSQVIGGGSELQTNSSHPHKDDVNAIGNTYASTKPRRKANS